MTGTRTNRVLRFGFTLGLTLALAGLGCATGSGPGSVSRTDERKAESHYKIGIERMREGRMALAIREFQAAAEFDPTDAWIQLSMAEAYRLKGYPKLAEEGLLEALRLRPDFQLERYDEAIAQTQSLLADPTFPVPWKALTNQGWAQYELGLLQDARWSLEQAVEYHETYWQAILNLGILDAEEGNRLEALERFDQVLALTPGSLAVSETNYRIGEIYIALGNRARAVEHLTAAASNRPSGPWGKRSKDYLKRLE